MFDMADVSKSEAFTKRLIDDHVDAILDGGISDLEGRLEAMTDLLDAEPAEIRKFCDAELQMLRALAHVGGRTIAGAAIQRLKTEQSPVA